MVDRHDPYPRFALDRHWHMVRANRTATRLMGGFGIAESGSLLDALLDLAPLRDAIVNLDEVAVHTRARLVAESRHYGGDPVLDGAIERLDAATDVKFDPGAANPIGAFVPVRYRVGDTELSFVSAFSHFQNAQDVAMAEIRVELMFPADERTKEALGE